MAGSRSREGGRPGEDPGLSHEQWEPWMVFEQERHALFGMFQGTSADLSSVLSSSRWDGETQAGRSPGTLGGSTGSGLLRGDGGKAELQQVKKGRGVIRAEEMQVLWQWGQHPVLGKPGGPWGSGGPRQQEARHEGCECCWGHWLSPEGSQIHTSNREADCWRRGGGYNCGGSGLLLQGLKARSPAMRGCRAPHLYPLLLPKLSSDMPGGLERRLTPPWQVLHEMGEGLWACGSSLGVPGNWSIQHAEVRGQGSKHGSLLNVALPREALLQAGSWALLTTSYGRPGWFPFADGETETQRGVRLAQTAQLEEAEWGPPYLPDRAGSVL